MKLVIRLLLMVALIAAVVFGCAGRLDLPFVWAWWVISAASMLVVVLRMDPGLMEERRRPGAGGLDRGLRIAVAPFWLGHLVVAGLDVGRFHWSPAMPVVLQVVGLIVLAGACLLSARAALVNRFYSPVVRIQDDRGHVLITDGPYGWVRHPGYVGALASLPAGAFALGSWWSLAPLVPLLVLTVRRTIIEDRFLHENLAGYPDYARRVRYRLIPGVW